MIFCTNNYCRKWLLSLIFFNLILFSQITYSWGQVTIWEENFAYPNATTSATKDGISWSTSGVSAGEGVAVYNNILRGNRTNQGGRDTWNLDNSIDISSYLNVSITAEVSSSGSLETYNDYVQVQYSYDSINWNIFENNGYQQGNISGTVAVSQNGLQGSSLFLKIVLRNNSGSEYYYVDNIVVTGLLLIAPSCTSLDYPVNGSSSVSLNTNLAWNSDIYATGYYLYFGTDNPPTNIVNGSSFTSLFYDPPTDLNTNTTYYWKVVPYNSSASASGCPVWTFTTGTTAVVDTTIRQLFNNGQDLTFNFPFTGCSIISDGLLTVTVHGDINGNASNEFYLINHETGLVGQLGPTYSGSDNCDLATSMYTININEMQSLSSDNTITIIAHPENGVDELCPSDDPSYVEMTLQYSYATIPTCEIVAPGTVCINEQNISFSAPDEMDSYSWSIVSGDAVINGSKTTQNILVNAGVSDFTIELVIESYPGCSETCTYDVFITEDSENPVISCPADVVAVAEASTCVATGVYLGVPTTSDNCGIASVSNNSPASFPIGLTTVTWTVTDYSGNTATCQQSVTINSAVPDFDANVTNTSCPSDADGGIEINLPIPIQFDSPDYIDLGSTQLSNRSQFTLEGWIKVDLADVGSRISLFGQNDAIEFGFMSSSVLNCWTASGGSVSVTNAYPSDNEWHHVAAVGNGTTIVLYIDGSPVATGGSSTSNYGIDNNYSSKLGAGVWDPTGGNFPGSMLKVGFWSVALDASEISNLASDYYKYTGAETGLLAGFNFTEGSGTTLNSVISGTDGTFNGTPTWNDTYSYSWTKTGDGSFSSSTKNLTGISSGDYNLTVSFGGCTRSKSFTVNSDFDIPSISLLSTPSALCVGESFNPSDPSVNNNGSPLLSQGWEIETSVGSGIFTGLAIPHTAVFADDGKNIRYFATNSCGTSYSNEVTLTVNSPPVATVSSNNGPVCIGGNAEFTIIGTTDATVTYSINGGTSTLTTLTGGTALISVSSVSSDQTLQLISVDFASCSTSLSESSVVSIYPVPTATLSGGAIICSGQSTNLSVSFTGTAPYSFTYTDGTTPVTLNGITGNPYSFNVSPSASATYTLTSYNDANCQGTFSGSAGVAVSGNIVHTPVNDTTICPGGTATLKIKLYEKAVLFDGNNGRISITNSNNINTSVHQNRTVAFWFKAQNVSTRQVLYEEGAQVNGFSVYLEGGYVYVHAWESNTTWGEVKTTVNADTWYNVAFVFDAAAPDGEYFKGYLDGVYFGGNSDPSATNGMNAHSGDINIGMNGGNLRFPDNSSNSNSYYFDGYIDEFKLWNRSLSETELQTERWNVNDGSQSGSNLIVYYNFNNDAGSTATDETGGDNGSVSGGVTYETDTPFTPTISWSPGGMTGFVETVSPAASTAYTYTLSNALSGCETSGSITVTVDSPVSPAISRNGPVCPGSDAIFTITGTPGDVVDYNGDATGTATIDAGGSATVTIPAVSADVTLNLINVNNGNCDLSLTGISETVTVEDIINPTITCPAHVNVTADANSCTATGVSLGTPVVNDNCGVDSYNNDAPSAFSVGTTIVEWTVTDNIGLTGTCQQNVTVNPSVIPDLEVVALSDNCQSGDNGSQTILSWTINKISGVGNWNYTYSISDGTSIVASGSKVDFTGSYDVVEYAVDNEAGIDKTFTITISGVSDSCGTGETNTVNNSDTVTLFGLPATSNIQSN